MELGKEIRFLKNKSATPGNDVSRTTTTGTQTASEISCDTYRITDYFSEWSEHYNEEKHY